MAIVALVPGALGRHLDRLRRRLDPEGEGGLPAHIPLVGPFRARPSFLPLEQHCWQVCHEAAPFGVELGRLVLGGAEGIARLEIASGGDQLAALREAFLTGKYAPPRNGAPYEPCAVVGRVVCRDELALAQWKEAVAQLGPSFLLERIDLMAQYPNGAWYGRDFYTLDRAVATV